MRAGDRFTRACFLIGRLPFRDQQMPIKNVVNQSRFAGTGNAGHAGENADRKIDIYVFQIVFARAGDLDRRFRSSAFLRNRNRFATAKIIARERLGSARGSRAVRRDSPRAWMTLGRRLRCDISRYDRRAADRRTRAACAPQHLIERSIEDEFAAALAASRADVDQIVGRTNDLLFVLDHEE